MAEQYKLTLCGQHGRLMNNLDSFYVREVEVCGSHLTPTNTTRSTTLFPRFDDFSFYPCSQYYYLDHGTIVTTFKSQATVPVSFATVY